jgi:carboxyl-terminal processing protease
MNRTCVRVLMIAAMAAVLVSPAWSQRISSFDRGRALAVWDQVSSDIDKHYYDPKFHGLDWKATVAETREKINSCQSFDVALGHIAQTLVSLNDSHTFFIPPMREYFRGYGFHMAVIGDQCYVIRVRPGTDAEAKGLKPGDEIISVNVYQPVRKNMWLIKYRYEVLRPDASLKLTIRDLAGQQRQVEVTGDFIKIRYHQESTSNFDRARRASENARHLRRVRWAEAGDVGILKIPVFEMDLGEAKGWVKKARKHSALIVDLRGNPGGTRDSLRYFLGGFFEKDVKVCDRVERKETKPESAPAWKDGIFIGKLVVLVDSESASASELFARIMQLEKRGTVVGDRTAGSVMESRHYTYRPDLAVGDYYGASVTEADLIMSDGKSLEHIGVTPDEWLSPMAEALSTGSDPVLAHSVVKVGGTLSAEDAWKLFPHEWPKDIQ